MGWRRIAAIVSSLPPEVVGTAQARALDLGAAVKQVLAEFGE